MKVRHLIAFCLILTLLVSLCGCADSAKLPEGMQLCADSDELGYTMYAPEGWTVFSMNGISAAYVSQVNQTSVTLAPADFSTLTHTTNAQGQSEPDFQTYFDTYLTSFPYAITPAVPQAVSVKLGNAEAASSFVYTFQYQERSFKCMQVLATYGQSLFIFTYNSLDETYEGSDKTYYEQYYTLAKDVMTNLIFRAPTAPTQPSYPSDSDGYLLVSDHALCNFDLFMPADWRVSTSSGIVSIRTEDGASVTMTEATGTGVTVRTYFTTRLEELHAIADNIVLYTTNNALPYPEDVEELNGDTYKDIIRACSFANAKQAAECEYSYRYGGVEYRVLQYLAIKGGRGYVFTYTAPTDVFASHETEVDRIVEKVSFR